MPTVTSKQLNTLFQRQEKIEKELGALKRIIFLDDEDSIRPETLKRWERISSALNKKKGHSFSSVTEIKKWLKNL